MSTSPLTLRRLARRDHRGAFVLGERHAVEISHPRQDGDHSHRRAMPHEMRPRTDAEAPLEIDADLDGTEWRRRGREIGGDHRLSGGIDAGLVLGPRYRGRAHEI